MKLMRIATFTLAGLLLAGCQPEDQAGQFIHKIERGEPDMWNLEGSHQLPEDQIPPAVMTDFRQQFGQTARITFAEERQAYNNHTVRIYFVKNGTRSSMDYSLLGSTK